MKDRSELKQADSIYIQAKNKLEIMKKTAEKMKTKKEMEHNLWRDDDYQQEYDATHKVKLQLKDAQLTREQFYAIGEILDYAVHSLCAVLDKQGKEKKSKFLVTKVVSNSN